MVNGTIPRQTPEQLLRQIGEVIRQRTAQMVRMPDRNDRLATALGTMYYVEMLTEEIRISPSSPVDFTSRVDSDFRDQPAESQQERFGK